jgi:hypothetical protein
MLVRMVISSVDILTCFKWFKYVAHETAARVGTVGGRAEEACWESDCTGDLADEAPCGSTSRSGRMLEADSGPGWVCVP